MTNRIFFKVNKKIENALTLQKIRNLATSSRKNGQIGSALKDKSVKLSQILIMERLNDAENLGYLEILTFDEIGSQAKKPK